MYLLNKNPSPEILKVVFDHYAAFLLNTSAAKLAVPIEGSNDIDKHPF
jgi:hypothetical protein